MPGLKVLLESKQKSGKTCFILSACHLGPLAVADTEFAWHNYVMVHPTINGTDGSKKRYTPRPHVKTMLGVTPDSWPVIALLQSNDLGRIRSFLQAAAADPEIQTLGLDSASVLWDIASSTVEGRQDWGKAKQPLRALQRITMASGKHYLFTAHLNPLFNEDMTKKIGEFPWSEKKDPHWADYELKLEFGPGMKAPRAIVIGERSGGRFRPGTVLKDCNFPSLLSLVGGDEGKKTELAGEVLSAEEETYRARIAQADESAVKSFTTSATSTSDKEASK